MSVAALIEDFNKTAMILLWTMELRIGNKEHWRDMLIAIERLHGRPAAVDAALCGPEECALRVERGDYGVVGRLYDAAYPPTPPLWRRAWSWISRRWRR